VNPRRESAAPPWLGYRRPRECDTIARE